MREWDIFDDVESLQNEYICKQGFGVVYVLEIGNQVKIGMSTNPYSRLRTIKRDAEVYGEYLTGRIALSESHSNYMQNELIIHKSLQRFRRDNSEVFDIGFIWALNLIYEIDIKYEYDFKSSNNEHSDSKYLQWAKELNRATKSVRSIIIELARQDGIVFDFEHINQKSTNSTNDFDEFIAKHLKRQKDNKILRNFVYEKYAALYVNPKTRQKFYKYLDINGFKSKAGSENKAYLIDCMFCE